MIFPTTLIITTSPTDHFTKFCLELNNPNDINNPDILRVDDYSIVSIRQISLFLSKTPYAHSSKIVFIPDIDLLHLEAQNALLKMLEEPGDNNYFFLTTSQPQKLIPTILSRCQIINHTTIPTSTEKIVYPNGILRDDIPDAKLFLKEQLTIHQKELVKNPTLSEKKIIDRLIRAIAMTEANVDPKSALDYFLLNP
ncbi:MAG: AAA family ATPase [Candidatus Shapirobacteria bacterium]|nr:AAA family ATPase [Candidatus Shapirobacteria bacterium]